MYTVSHFLIKMFSILPDIMNQYMVNAYMFTQ
jgi:hypothetical protein